MYRIPLWQCPSFMFLIMGFLIIISMVGTYLISSNYTEEPEVAALIVIIVTLIMFIVGHSIVTGFNDIAEANRMKSEFVSIVSHQLRNPLTSLKWSLDMMINGRIGELSKKHLDYLNMIKESNERMIKMVNDLLDVNKIEERRIRLEPQNFSIISATEDAITDLKSLASASNVEIVLNADKDIPQLFADSERIRMVIQNLLDNAVRYTFGKGKVDIQIRKELKKVRWVITDNGVGIPKVEQKKIFDKFFRSDNVMKHQVKGSGLGLFIAKAIIDASGGQIGFKSEERNGSTFWFTLPIK